MHLPRPLSLVMLVPLLAARLGAVELDDLNISVTPDPVSADGKPAAAQAEPIRNLAMVWAHAGGWRTPGPASLPKEGMADGRVISR